MISRAHERITNNDSCQAPQSLLLNLHCLLTIALIAVDNLERNWESISRHVHGIHLASNAHVSIIHPLVFTTGQHAMQQQARQPVKHDLVAHQPV